MRGLTALAASLLLAACDSPFFNFHEGELIDGGSPDGGPGAPRCLSYRTESFPIDPALASGTPARIAIPLAPGVVLTSAGEPSRWYVLTSTGSSTPIDLGAPGLVPLSAARRGERELWIGGRDGQLWRGEIEDGRPRSLAAVSATAGFDLAQIDVSAAPAGLEVVALALPSGESPAHAGVLLRFDGRGWSRIWGPGPALRPNDRGSPGVAWVGPGEAFAISFGARCLGRDSCVLHLESGLVVEEEVPAFQQPTAIAVVPGLGPIAGTERGHLLERDDQNARWTVIQGGPEQELQEAIWVRRILPFGGGVLYATSLWIGQLRPGLGYCADPVLNTHHRFTSRLIRVRGAALFGTTLMLVGEPEGPATFAVMRPFEP